MTEPSGGVPPCAAVTITAGADAVDGGRGVEISASSRAVIDDSATWFCWNEASRSSVGRGVSRSQSSRTGFWRRRRASISAARSRCSTQRSTAVFNPLKLKSSVLPFIFGEVNFTALGSP